MNSKNIKVAYTTRFLQNGTSTVPKIQMEGKWLEQLGFSIGTTLIVEYEEGSIRIRPMNAEEIAFKEQQELRRALERKTAELHSLEANRQKEYPTLSKVAESSNHYGI